MNLNELDNMTDISSTNSPWDAIVSDAASSPNADIAVETTDPLFDKQVTLATLEMPEPSDVRDGRGLQVRLGAVIAQTIESTEGLAKTNGWKWNGRPIIIEAINPSDERQETRARIGRRDLAAALVAAGLLKRGEAPDWARFVSLIPKLAGKQVVLRFDLRPGNKQNDDGSFTQFQNVRFERPGTANPTAPSTGDY